MTMRLVRAAGRPVRKPTVAAAAMTSNPKSIDQSATVRETAEVLQEHGIHVAPVIDEAGRPIGVVSRTDILDYWGRRRDRLTAMAAGEREASSDPDCGSLPGDELTVRDIMTPVVFGVRVDASLKSVVEKMLALEVRSLFVTDDHGVLVGTISVFDVLRCIVRDTVGSTGDMRNGAGNSSANAGRTVLATAIPP